jgi:hypothetical protein
LNQNKVIKFDLDPKTLKVKELLNKDFLELEIKAISTANPNRNGSHFTLESLAKAIPTFYNKPILGSFSVSRDDFRGHEGDLEWDDELGQLYYDYTDDTAETPLGMIRGDDKIEIYHDDKDGLDWIKFTCAIWVKYNYKQVKKLLKSKNGHKKISVEVEVNDYEIDENGIEIIKDFTFDGVTILGDNLETGIADANLTILDMIDNALFQKKQKCLCYAYDALNKNESCDNLDENLDSQNSDKEAFSSETVPNEGVEEIEMNQENQEGGKQKMLTYEGKRTLLQSYLTQIETNDECNCCYAWVCDLDETHVYFEMDGKYYRASYSITISESENEEPAVVINMEEKQQVIRSWSTFESEIVTEEVATVETFEENPEETPEEEPKMEESKEQCEAEPADVDDATDADEADDADDADVDNDKDVDFVSESAQNETAEEDNQETFAEPNEPVDLNEEPEDVETKPLTTEEIIEESTASVVAPEVQTEAGQVGDANTQVAEVMEEEVAEAVIDENSATITTEVSEGPDGQPATVVGTEVEDDSQVEQPNDNDKEKIFEVATVEIDGENVDINSLLEKYNSLKNDYDTLNQTIKLQKAKALANFGADFIKGDTEVDEETKESYIAQVAEKCESFEFTSEEEVVKFAKGLLAMYYYEARTAKKNSSDFSIAIEHPVHVDKPASGSKLKEAINKLNHI